MNNYHDFSYTGSILIGGPNAQALEVVYDTGSDWLTIEGSECYRCSGNTFEHRDSSSFQYLEAIQSQKLEYGSAELQGLRASDKVCLPATSDQSTELSP